MRPAEIKRIPGLLNERPDDTYGVDLLRIQDINLPSFSKRAVLENLDHRGCGRCWPLIGDSCSISADALFTREMSQPG
jgi:hypothetical protein